MRHFHASISVLVLTEIEVGGYQHDHHDSRPSWTVHDDVSGLMTAHGDGRGFLQIALTYRPEPKSTVPASFCVIRTR
jgi:hypothetical protein